MGTASLFVSPVAGRHSPADDVAIMMTGAETSTCIAPPHHNKQRWNINLDWTCCNSRRIKKKKKVVIELAQTSRIIQKFSQSFSTLNLGDNLNLLAQ